MAQQVCFGSRAAGKSAINKAIDKAREKGLFDKAAKRIQDKFKGR